jgi:hypothetical protein
MNSTYRALTKAGFNQLNFPKLREVMFITESEAAAHYVARFYRDEKGQQILKVGDLVHTITYWRPLLTRNAGKSIFHTLRCRWWYCGKSKVLET